MEEKTKSLADLYKGLTKFRSQLKQPEKDSTNPYFNTGYVTLSGIQRAIDTALKDTGLSYLQLVSNSPDGSVGVETIITHESGQSISSGVLTLTPAKKDAQGYGSSITYAKRYQLSAMFGVSSDIDDDGNAAVEFKSPQNKQHEQKRSVSQSLQQSNNISDEQALILAYYGKLNETITVTKMPKEDIIAIIREETEKNPNYNNMTNLNKFKLLINCLDMLIKKFKSTTTV